MKTDVTLPPEEPQVETPPEAVAKEAPKGVHLDFSKKQDGKSPFQKATTLPDSGRWIL